MSATQTPNPGNAAPQNQPTGSTPQGPTPSNTLSAQTIQDLQTHVAQGGSLSLVGVNGDIVGGVGSNVSSNLFNNLGRSLHSLSSDVNALVQTQGQKKPTIRASNPEKFSGNSHDVENFIRDIDASIAFQESSFTSDHLKAEYFGSFLGKRPRAWFHSIRTTNPVVLGDFKAFKDEFRKFFGDPDEATAYLHKLQNIRQTGSALKYTTAFQELLIHIPSLKEDLPKKILYRAGLKHDLAKALIHYSEPASFADFTIQVIEVDNKMYKFNKQMERNNFTGFVAQPAKDPDAMEIYHLRKIVAAISPSPSTSSIAAVNTPAYKKPKAKGPLTSTEKERRIANNLCLYCGKPGHLATDDACPDLIAKNKRNKGKGKDSGKGRAQE